MNINRITLEDLRNKKYQEFIPDLYVVKGLIEVNPWHDHQDIFDHILKVYKSLNEILINPPISKAKLPLLEKRLSKKYASLTSKEILKLMVLYHDLGKRFTLITNKDGTTQNPGHEQVAAAMIPDMVKTLNLQNEEIQTLILLVSLHGFVGDIATVYGKQQDQDLLKLFSERARGLEVELIIFMLADLNGSDLKEMNQEQYIFYKKTLGTMLNFYI